MPVSRGAAAHFEIAICDLNRVRPQWHDRDMAAGSGEQGLELIPLPTIQKRIWASTTSICSKSSGLYGS
jgi:hypothetical protein